ncbi:MAG: hypothetical protein WAU53_03015, partial [Rhodoplanes sp.]
GCPATPAADAPLFATRSPARDNNNRLRRAVPVLPESASRDQPSGLSNPDPISQRDGRSGRKNAGGAVKPKNKLAGGLRESGSSQKTACPSHPEYREQPESNTGVDLAAVFQSISTDPIRSRLNSF